MDGPFARVLAFFAFMGFLATATGGYRCIVGYTYSVAAQHETTTVGRVVSATLERPVGWRNIKLNPLADIPTDYRFVFSVNGVKMDDTDQVCATPLAAGACSNNGPVLVYYSYQPYSNARLEDFAVAGRNTIRSGELPLGIGFPVLVLSCTGIFILARKNKGEDDSDPDAGSGTSKSDDLPDAIHIVPRE